MFARTPRLLLRPGWAEDAPALAALLGRALAPAGLPWPCGVADARALLTRDAGPLPEFLIILRAPGGSRLVGGIGLRRDAAGEAELGCWIAPPHRRLGYATEAGRAVIELAHRGLRLRRVVSGHRLDDPAAGHVLRRLGFRPAGRGQPRRSARGETVPYARFEHEDTVEPAAMAPLAA